MELYRYVSRMSLFGVPSDPLAGALSDPLVGTPSEPPTSASLTGTENPFNPKLTGGQILTCWTWRFPKMEASPNHSTWGSHHMLECVCTGNLFHTSSWVNYSYWFSIGYTVIHLWLPRSETRPPSLDTWCGNAYNGPPR
jgi:hypothetical protein